MANLALHPVFYAIYKILYYGVFPGEKVPLNIIITNTAIMLLFCLTLWFILAFFTKEFMKSGLLTTIFVVLFFNFRTISNYLEIIFFSIISRQAVGTLSLGFFVILIVLLVYVILKTQHISTYSKILNLYTGALLLICLVKMGYNLIYEKNYAPLLNRTEVTVKELDKVNGELPNIYYIVLDEYARSDVIKNEFGFSNSELLNFLSDKGFFVPSKSCSNYMQTALSIASSLNYTYLDDRSLGIESKNRVPLINMINYNDTIKYLKHYNYKFITFSTGYHGTEIKGSDRYLTTPRFLSDFQNMLLNFTPLPLLLKKVGIHFQYDWHRERILFSFSKLQELAKEPQPFFAFAHILAVHHPYVFTKAGDAFNPDLEFDISENVLINQDGFTKDDYRKLYLNQLIFINNQLIKTIEIIIKNNRRPVIIILQGDHGCGISLRGEKHDLIFKKNRLSIFNAYYFYDHNYSMLYPTITPVNTFRVIFNQYFGNNIDLLRDESFYSTWSRPYDFSKIDVHYAD